MFIFINSLLIINLKPALAAGAYQVSTYSELVNAISNAPAGAKTTIDVTSDFSFTSMCTIPAGKNITIQTVEGDSVHILSQSTSNTRHFQVLGVLTLTDIVINGATPAGGIYVKGTDGILNINKETVIQNCITGSRTGGGGVEVDAGTVNMDGGTVKNNSSTVNVSNGGGLYFYNHALFNMSGGLIDNNTSARYGGGIGGATCTVKISGGTIQNNTASGSGAESGGGVYINTGDFVMTGGIVDGNTTKGSGGGISLAGVGNGNISGDSIIQNNTALGTGESSRGGGVYLNGTGRVFTMENTAAIVNNTAYNGGGLAAFSGVQVNIKSGKISNNSASSVGGGLYLSEGITFHFSGGVVGGDSGLGGNTADVYGGGIAILGSNSTSIGTMSGDARISYNKSNDKGGGVFLLGYTAANTNFIMKDQSKIDHNTAVTGGGISSFNGNYKADGVTLTLNDDSSIRDNVASGIGGGINGSYLKSLVMSGNAAVQNNKAATGGGIAFIDGETFTMSSGVIADNTATGKGGGLYISGTYKDRLNQVTMSGGRISRNSAANGGGVDLENFSEFIMGAGEVSDNTAQTNGGGILTNGTATNRARVAITDGLISHNTAQGSGAGSGGGGIYHSTGTGMFLEISGATQIINNDAPNGSGGGIYKTASPITTGSGTLFSGNHASYATQPDANLKTIYPTIEWDTLSIATTHPMNNYDINYESTQLGFLNISKEVTGDAPSGDSFTFVVTKGGIALTGNYMVDGIIHSISENGEITLQSGEQAKLSVVAGDDYRVVEQEPGTQYTTIYNVDSLSTQSGRDSGLLTVADNMTTDLVFTNQYISGKADVSIDGEKKIYGVDSTDQTFTFYLTQVTDAEGDTPTTDGITDTAQTTGADTFSFQLKNLTEGTYYFKITEQSGSINDWIYDSSAPVVIVDVTDNQDGTAAAEVTYPDGNKVIFNNIYGESTTETPGTESSTTEMPGTESSTTEPSPKTGDDRSSLLIWIGLFMSCLGIVLTLFFVKKPSKN